jgi:hypothetical protein
MTNTNDKLRFFVTTYSHFSHNYLIATLSSRDVEYRYIEMQNEEAYSRFEVISDLDSYTILKQLSEENNGTAFSIEYGTY